MCGEKIAANVLEMISDVEENCKIYEDEDTVHFSVYTYLHDHRTVSYRVSRRSGHTTAARLLLNELPDACVISVKERDNLQGSRCFNLRDIWEGKAKGTRFSHVIVDNWSCVPPIDRGYIQEFCILQRQLPILVLLA